MFPQTSVLKHVPGWTLFDNLYVLLLFVLCKESLKLPQIRLEWHLLSCDG